MKPYYTQDVLITASREELAKIRVALSCWLFIHGDWETSEEPEKVDYYVDMRVLHTDVTKTLDSLPF